MRRIRLSMTILGVVMGMFSLLAIVPHSPVAASAAHSCSNSTLRGGYSFHSTGTTPTGEPFATIGVFSFDGDGNLTGTLFTRRTGGVNVGPLSLTGTYTVNPNCTVSDTWVFGNGASATHESVIFDDGRGYFLINTNALGDLSVISGEGRKQFSREREEREDDQDSR